MIKDIKIILELVQAFTSMLWTAVAKNRIDVNEKKMESFLFTWVKGQNQGSHPLSLSLLQEQAMSL